MSHLQPNCCLEFDFRKVDQHAGGKWLIHDTKRRKDNQLQSLKLPCRISLESISTTYRYGTFVCHRCLTISIRGLLLSEYDLYIRPLVLGIAEFCDDMSMFDILIVRRVPNDMLHLFDD